MQIKKLRAAWWVTISSGQEGSLWLLQIASSWARALPYNQAHSSDPREMVGPDADPLMLIYLGTFKLVVKTPSAEV